MGNGGSCAARLGRVVVVVVAAAMALMGVGPVARAATTADPDWGAALRCTSPIRPTVTLTDTGFRVYDSAYGYRYDDTLFTRSRWASPPSTDTVYNLEVYGLLWMPSLLTVASTAPDGVERLERLVTSTAATLAWRPDTGRDTDPVWGEGTNLRRQENLNCLYSVTHDSRLVPLISAVAKANLDPQRYYGPPVHPAHNHGLMANLALLNASVLLGRSDWRAAALSRMHTALDASFSPAGLSIEQSSAYHQSVLAKWVAASRLLRDIGGADTTDLKAAVDAVILRATRALDFLLMPDGIPVPFGDQVGLHRDPTPTARHLLVDPVAGVLAGRWSWAAPDDFVAARFGGPRQMHGHEDRMSVVWWATGRPVLDDPGTSTYVAGPARNWVVGPLSHSIPTVPGHAFVSKAPITISSVQASRLYAFTLSGRPWGVAQSRRVVVDPRADRLTLTDTATAPVSPVLQLDHRWAARSVDSAHRVATFVDGTGAVLTIRTTGRISSIKRGQAGLAGGWTFSYPPERRAAAARIVITGGTSVVTTLQVIGPAVTPWAS